MIICGIDPAFTRLAFTLVEYKDGERKHVLTKYLRTPNLKDKKTNLKQNTITNYKLEKIFRTAWTFFLAHHPDVIAIEAYQPIKGKTAHAGKIMSAVVAVKCAVFAVEKIPMEYSSSEMRRIVLGRASGSKEEMWAEVLPKYNPVMPEVLDSEKEHLYDSCVIAETALLEIIEDMKMRGGSL